MPIDGSTCGAQHSRHGFRERVAAVRTATHAAALIATLSASSAALTPSAQIAVTLATAIVATNSVNTAIAATAITTAAYTATAALIATIAHTALTAAIYTTADASTASTTARPYPRPTPPNRQSRRQWRWLLWLLPTKHDAAAPHPIRCESRHRALLAQLHYADLRRGGWQ